MDLVKLFSVTANELELSQGQAVNGWTNLSWVERYQSAGDFELKAPLSSGLREFLPVGSFITHLKTSEVMMIENHEIDQPKDKDPTITISGRSLAAYLENRTVGENVVFDTGVLIATYILSANPTWEQLVTLIFNHINATSDTDNNLPGTYTGHTCSGTSTIEDREVKIGNVYERVLEILKVDDLGLKIVRPIPTDDLTYFIIYQGEDRTDRVRFSWMGGDLDRIKYFESNKKLKTRARIIGRWVQTLYEGPEVDYQRRTMIVDASDIDQQQSSMPTGGALTLINAAMRIRGQQALANQRLVTITEADVSDNAKMQYRRDYFLGDLVTVDGDFGVSQVFRVSEFAEIVDENGTTGHPTLTIPGEG